MKFRSMILAATLLSAVGGLAFAQSSPSPNNQSGPSVSPSVPAPTDQGAGAAASGNTKGIPERGAARAPHGAATTGAGSMATSGSNMNESAKKNASPASPAEGVQKEK
ncbi:MAG TPA: hypothetical protein VFA57_00820 [Pseudolabrys sp.]|jgi:hypothetical protein|nr:hypothetical protein [Pseudolabrys sp.]